MAATKHLRLVQEQEPDSDLRAWRARFLDCGAAAAVEALDYAARALQGRRLASGEPALPHALGTAGILLELKLDAQAVAAAVLAPAIECAPEAAAQLRERFGGVIADLVEGVGRMNEIGSLSSRDVAARRPEQQAQQSEPRLSPGGLFLFSYLHELYTLYGRATS